MTEHEVTHVRKDDDGNIIAFCNPSIDWEESKHEVIRNIENGSKSYYVKSYGTSRSYIHVFPLGRRKYLRTNPDGFGRNNLNDLPIC